MRGAGSGSRNADHQVFTNAFFDASCLTKLRNNRYLVTANESDARDWDCLSDEMRVKDATLDPAVGNEVSGTTTVWQVGRG